MTPLNKAYLTGWHDYRRQTNVRIPKTEGLKIKRQAAS